MEQNNVHATSESPGRVGVGEHQPGGTSVGGTHVRYAAGFGRPPFQLLQNDQNILILLELPCYCHLPEKKVIKHIALGGPYPQCAGVKVMKFKSTSPALCAYVTCLMRE